MAAETPYHLLHVFPSFEVGGMQVRTANLINSFDDRFRHSILALSGDYGCAELLRADAPVHLFTETKVPASYGAALIGAAKTIAAVDPDLLLTYNWASVDWALANALGPRRRHIHHEGGFNADEANRQLWRRIAYRRIALRGSDFLIVPAKSLREIAVKVWHQPPEKILLIPNGIDICRFPPRTMERSGHEATRTTVIGSLAPLRPEKNIAAILRVAARLRIDHSISLIIIGDGPERTQLEVQAKELGVADICLFEGLRHDIANALAQLDIFLLPSKTEQMPNSLLQAMAAALPVVGYAVGDITEIVSTENEPFIVPRGDEAILLERTAQVVEDILLRQRIGDANRARVRDHYGEAAMIERYADAYASVLAIDR